MSCEISIICALILSLKCSSALHLAKIVPQDVSTGAAVVYGFAPKLKIDDLLLHIFQMVLSVMTWTVKRAGPGYFYTLFFNLKGNDNRIGFGFMFGNHADFQILYEFGPQTDSKPLQPIRNRSTSYRQYQRKARRRPFLEFLIRMGLLEVKPVATYVQNTISDINIKPPL